MTAEQYIDELERERDILDGQDFQHAVRLLEAEIQVVRMNNEENYQSSLPQSVPVKHYNNNIPGTQRHTDTHGEVPLTPETENGLYKEEIVKLSEKILLPVDENPRFNFVGKIIGPKGSTMKAIQNVTKTRIMVQGKGSTRDREQEELLSQSDDPKHEHFKEPLHLMIKVKAPRSEAHERLANAMDEINKCLQAENEDVYQTDVGERIQVIEAAGSIPQAPTPIIQVGIPPPGAIILNGPAPGTANGTPQIMRGVATHGQGHGRVHGRERPRPY